MENGQKVTITKGNTLYQKGETGTVTAHPDGKNVHEDPCRGASGETLLVVIQGLRRFYVPASDLSVG